MDAESGTTPTVGEARPTAGEASSPYAPRPGADLLAVLLGNVTLLGLGYVFLRRWRLALLALAGTTALVIALGATAGSPLVLTALALWAAAMVVHGWVLVRGSLPGARRWSQRIVAGVVVVALVALVVGLRTGTERTVRDAAAAHTAGDCERASRLLMRLGPADRTVHGPLALRGETDLEACGLLLDAEAEQADGLAAADALAVYMRHPNARWEGAGPRRAELLLDAAYDGVVDQKTLEAGFEQLSTTLEEAPGQAGRVQSVAEGFLADLAEEQDHCAVRDVVEWVDGQEWTAPPLAEPVAAASDEVPRRVLGCARTLADADELTRSRHTYEAFLEDFRDDRRAEVASDELYDVITAIQRKHVSNLLNGSRYCGDPRPYRGAEPYRRAGGNPMRVYGIDAATHFPRSWRATSLDDMVLVACVDGPKKGSYQDTCLYESDASPWGSEVRFYASRFDVKLYEVRTGRQVAAFSDEFGEPCPPSILVESYVDFFVPPESTRSSFTSAELRGMFEVYQN